MASSLHALLSAFVDMEGGPYSWNLDEYAPEARFNGFLDSANFAEMVKPDCLRTSTDLVAVVLTHFRTVCDVGVRNLLSSLRAKYDANIEE